jgi:hypothetical protein
MNQPLIVFWRVVPLALAALGAGACGGESSSDSSQAGTGGTSTSSGGASGAGGESGATGGSAGVTASGGAAGAGGECPGNPSGYACDAWSVHLYPTHGVRRETTELRLQIRHDPDLEGYPTDWEIAPGHEFSQFMTVTIDLTPGVRDYLCSVLVPSTQAEPIDPSLPEFSASVSQYVAASLLSPLPNDYLPHPDNVLDICGAGALTPIVNPGLVTGPTLPDIVLVLPLEPEPTGFQVGQTFWAWLARGILWVDEESELSPAVTVTIVDIQ